MALSRSLIKALLGLSMLLGCFVRGDAAELVLRLERAAIPGIQVEGVELHLEWPEKQAPQSVELRIKRVVLDAAMLELRALAFRCNLSFEAINRLQCAGPASWRDVQGDAHTALLHLEYGNTTLGARLALSETTLTLAWSQQAGVPLVITAQAMPVAWVQSGLQGLWPGTRLTDGLLGGHFELIWNEADTLEISGRAHAVGLGFDTDDGSVAAAGVNVEASFALALGERLQMRTMLELVGGELLFEQFYAELPARPLQLAFEAYQETNDQWRIDDLALSDSGVFSLYGSLHLDPDSEDWLQDANLDLNVTNADEVIVRYAGSLLGLAGLTGLRAEGGFEVQLRLDARGLRALELEAYDLYVLDAAGRFSLDAMSGALSLGPDAGVRESDLRWKAANFYRIGLGPLQLALRSGHDGIDLTAPAQIELLGGYLALEHLSWRHNDDEEADFEASLRVDQLDLAALTEAFDWPPFGGRLSGRIPAVHYDEGVLSFAGGLQVGVFDGHIDIDSLSMERPFGVLPTLHADIRFAALDLQQMTRVFDIGEIQGRLQGHVIGLRLIDWQPVAFDALLRTEKGASPRRISQRAVESLSSVGGGGGVAALQNSILRVFSTFGYDEIGLSCRLRNDVCYMDGVDSVGSGYAIVKGSGLPRISVIGHQRQVDWPVLLARLQMATTGAGPVMN